MLEQKSSPYNQLIGKLDAFIRRYYTNLLIRGAIFSAAYVLAFFLAINLLEYYFYMSEALRKLAFFGFLFSSIAFTGRYFILPLTQYYRLGKIISYDQAAQIIGAHFNEVKDKLLNILQLHRDANAPGSSLLLAAIDQKAIQLKPVDFSFAVDLSKNRKYLRFLIPPALLFLFIIIAAPNIIKDGSNRLYHNGTYYEKQSPFHYIIQNKELKALQFDNFDLEVKVDGSALPDEVYLESDKGSFKLRKKDKTTFTYEFPNLQSSVNFAFNANGFHSKNYKLEVVAKPVVAGFEVKCEYPPYTGKQNETLHNTGDLVVPAGTRLTWKFNTQNVEEIKFLVDDSAYSAKRSGSAEFTFAKTMMQSARYMLKVSNNSIKDADSVAYSLNVVPDLYPVISVNEQRDSAQQKYFYYTGEISDDYGLRRLTFNYQVAKSDSGAGVDKSIDVPIAGGTSGRFTYYWSLSDFNIKPGDKMTYYFEVWDNDGIHGSKSTKSTLMAFDMPTINQIDKELSKENGDLKKEMKDGINKAEELKNDLHTMQDKLQEKKELNWDDKKNLADNIDKQKNLQKQLEDIKNKMDQNFEKQNEFKDVDPAIAEKEKRLQDLFDKVMDKDMKELYDKLQKMLEQLEKKDALDKMDDMAANNEKLEKELDRMLELFKKLEFDQKLEETANKLEKLAQKQEDIQKQTEKNETPKDGTAKDQKAQDDLKKQQDKLNQDLKEAKKDVDDLKKLNEETQSQQDFKDIDKNMDAAQQDTKDAQQNMDKNQNSKASKSQQSAANNMKDASQKMGAMKMQMEQKEDAEDMDAIRQLLKNTLQLSFDEEKLMGDVKQTNINTPKYVDLMHEQQRIRENSKMVEDSLYAVARRQESISSFITKQMNDINRHLDKGVAGMEMRDVMRASSDEQFVMTGYNNLALMLSEALQQMQQQMSQSQDQNQDPSQSKKMCMKCKKPGNGKPSLSSLKQMQQQLNDKITQLGEMMKKEGKGQQKGQQGEGMSKEFAEMAQMQSQIRRELEKINEQENKDGKKSLGDLAGTAKQMEKTETQLVNKQLTTEMLTRQQEIMTRLLEAENAERERDEKKEYQAKSGQDQQRKIPPSIEAYLKAKQSETDLYKTVPPSLKPYYKALAEKYFRSLTIQQ